MLDTMGFIIPINREIYHFLVSKSLMTQRVDCVDGSVEFEYYNFELSHSWNYRVRWKLDDKKFIHDPGINKTVLASGYPHLRIEFSAPKIMLGNNIQTIDENLADIAVHTVKIKFEKTFNVCLPLVRNWFLSRLDVCSNYELPKAEMVKDIINYLQRLDYPRKKKDFHEGESIYCPSRHSTLKIYAKGPEFKAHDMKRFKNEVEARKLFNDASRIIRAEAELKTRLRYIASEYLNRLDMNSKIKIPTWNGYLKYYMMMGNNDREGLIDCKGELERMITNLMICKESKAMKAKDVHDKLRQNFSGEQADVFMGMYSVILTQGIKASRLIYNKQKMARALRAYRSLGISFINSDVTVIDSGINIPHDFTFKMDNTNPYYQIPLKEAA